MEHYYNILQHLLSHAENEVVEFKAARNNFDIDDLGKYFQHCLMKPILENVISGGWSLV